MKKILLTSFLSASFLLADNASDLGLNTNDYNYLISLCGVLVGLVWLSFTCHLAILIGSKK